MSQNESQERRRNEFRELLLAGVLLALLALTLI
jgi:hypothetical protein